MLSKIKPTHKYSYHKFFSYVESRIYVYISAKIEEDYLQKRSGEKNRGGEKSYRESAGPGYKQNTLGMGDDHNGILHFIQWIHTDRKQQ